MTINRFIALTLMSTATIGGVFASTVTPAVHAATPQTVTRGAVNKSTLLRTIRRAQAIQTNSFTPASVAVVQSVLAAVVNNTYHNTNASQAQVNAANTWLINAMIKATPYAYKGNLLHTIRLAQGVSLKYHSFESYSRVQAVLAQVINNVYHNSNASQSQVNNANWWLSTTLRQINWNDRIWHAGIPASLQGYWSKTNGSTMVGLTFNNRYFAPIKYAIGTPSYKIWSNAARQAWFVNPTYHYAGDNCYLLAATSANGSRVYETVQLNNNGSMLTVLSNGINFRNAGPFMLATR